MAIFDGASQKQMSATQRQLEMEIEQRRMQATLFNQAQQYGITSPGAVLGTTQKSVARFDPNKKEAYRIPLSQLVTMWQVKYGDEWVDGEKVYNEDDFYANACVRLGQNKLFESVDGWLRLKENVENILANR